MTGRVLWPAPASKEAIETSFPSSKTRKSSFWKSRTGNPFLGSWLTTSIRTREDCTRMLLCAELGCSGRCAKLPEIRNETKTTPSAPATVNFILARILFPPNESWCSFCCKHNYAASLTRCGSWVCKGCVCEKEELTSKNESHLLISRTTLRPPAFLVFLLMKTEQTAI